MTCAQHLPARVQGVAKTGGREAHPFGAHARRGKNGCCPDESLVPTGELRSGVSSRKIRLPGEGGRVAIQAKVSPFT
eukprot:1161878-Pelagomonas_calceolata.AAC.7